MRSPIRRRAAALAALCTGAVLAAGCADGAGAEGAASVRSLVFLPAGAHGPDPFTPSTVADASTARPSAPASGEGTGTGKAAGAVGAGGRARTLPGTTPGVYAGVQGLSSCDVERQVRLLTQDKARATAFAEAARTGSTRVPDYLRGLTPVVLRADTRVTGHGYRDGAPTAYQAVLQAGTAVLADDRGVPRVRCSCGNPLGPAVAMEGSVSHRGTAWDGYRPDRVLVISPAPRRTGRLTVVNSADNTWMERATGTDGDEDGVPAALPPYSPDADLFDPRQVAPADPALPDPTGEPTRAPSPEPTGSAAPSGPAEPSAPTGTATGGPDVPRPPDEQAAAGGGARGGHPLPAVPDDSALLIGPVNTPG
ncbi:DUF6777 domain-containing protein [Streptomyces tremellae]|uniref:DUF6777 domain-containing protein n=1 Tax=Streptomyces tremellae TaxID=1124239 RepID=A0ABP7GH57_9ACTN